MTPEEKAAKEKEEAEKKAKEEAEAEAKKKAEEEAKKKAEEEANLSPEEKMKLDIQKGIDEALKPIKEKLDNAYSERDEARKVANELKEKERAAELKALEDQGKYKEAYELKLKEEREKREALENQNLKLTRDTQLKTQLSLFTFRNENAFNMAYNSIVKELVKDGEGVWVHKSGMSITDFVKAYATNDDNAFLFKQKVSSGGGSTTTKKKKVETNESLFDKPQDEVLKLAKEGKLPRQQK